MFRGKFPVGSRVKGKVTSITDYGAFVQLEEGVEGLVHVSEMSWTKKVRHPSKILSVGDEVEVIVIETDMAQKRISLGLKQTTPNPWDTIGERYPVGRRSRAGSKISPSLESSSGSMRGLTDWSTSPICHGPNT